MADAMGSDFDVLIIGSGFGGSVAALRLTEKGYRVGILEAGRRFTDADFPKTSWRVNRFLFAPKLGLTGIQRIHRLKDVIILAGAGVGGGSLVYANTLYVPPQSYFDDPQWKDITDWRDELSPWYDQASRMLGVVENPYFSPSDAAIKDVAEQMGVGHTFRLAPVGIFIGHGPGIESPDPFFGGKGPTRNGCQQCGACMTGCPNNAKNTLPKNYLGLAEAAGATVFPLTTATRLEEQSDSSWVVHATKSTSWSGKERSFTAREVVVAAGTYSTQKLLHRMKSNGNLPRLSPRLGRLSRTNSEALVGATMSNLRVDYSQGSAITSSFYPDEHTHIEPVRYGKGSNLMGLLQTIMTDGHSARDRRREWLGIVARKPRLLARMLNVRKWSERTIIALVMQNVDSSITVSGKRGIFGLALTSRNDSATPNATWIPAANDAVRRIAANLGGTPGGNLGDLINAPFTAHFVGGCVIGADEGSGVIDPYHRVWNYPTLHVVDGSAITANLGVNPSLTITAQAERACSLWPNFGEADLRPMQGDGYRRLPPVRPLNPAVPDGVPGTLR